MGVNAYAQLTPSDLFRQQAQPQQTQAVPDQPQIQTQRQGQSPAPSRSTTPPSGLSTRDDGISSDDNDRPADLPSSRLREAERRPENTPEPPTEFQQFVRAATGRSLPIFGAALFDRVPSTFAPLDHVPVPADYTTGPGDEVQVTVWGQINFNRALVVDQVGNVYLPQVGPIHVAGLRYAQLEGALRAAIGRVYRNFELTVTMGQLRSIQVFVVGQARRPGSYTLGSLSTLVNALFASGGPSSRGSMRRIQLKRGDKTVTEFDLYELLLNGDKSKDSALQPGDVIFIPAVGPQVAVTGSIDFPAIYEIKGGSTLGESLNLAGGLSPVSTKQNLSVERIGNSGALEALNVSLDSTGMQTKLENGDIVRVLNVVPRFQNSVTLRGNVADPVRRPWHAGMRVSDLIPDRSSLLTRDYWRERNRLVLTETPTTDTPEAARDQLPGGSSDAINSHTREEKQTDTADRSLGALESSTRNVTVRRFDTRTQIQQPAPDIDWDYAAIERLDPATLTTHVIPFNLGKVVLNHDASEDIPLEPGDVVTIFSKADLSVPQERRTKYVRVEGEVVSAGVYSVGPGETLRDVVKRAGGLTPNAYLYGCEFTRESTRRQQQQRLNEFLDTLDSDINEAAANLGGRVLSADAALASQSSLASQRSVVSRLRQTPATGRIVFDLEYSSQGVDALPAITLEDGDRLFVPNRPNSVSVVGSVYNQSAFLYADDLRLGDYLHDAGGFTRFADRSHVFVIRADGSVVGRANNSGLFTRSFDTLRLYPGDALVVPNNVNKTTFLRGFVDWSQVVSNFALGAAAVNVLK